MVVGRFCIQYAAIPTYVAFINNGTMTRLTGWPRVESHSL